MNFMPRQLSIDLPQKQLSDMSDSIRLVLPNGTVLDIRSSEPKDFIQWLEFIKCLNFNIVNLSIYFE